MTERSSRQSFLGKNSDDIFCKTKIAIVGVGGGGSHIVQQLAHIGFDNYILYDPQNIEESNLNRLIGATLNDIGTLKTNISERIIRGLRDKPIIEIYNVNWQEKPGPLRQADIIFGCLDSFAERRDLEALARRYLIPYIDIGMDVFSSNMEEPPRMVGQIILSLPGGPCMKCLGYLTEESLAREAAGYGAAGSNPQVVWSNGVIASTAVGLGIQLLTGWSGNKNKLIYLSYDGNLNTLTPHVRLEYITDKCIHYLLSNVGDPVFKSL